MFNNAQEARDWLREHGYTTPSQLILTMPELGQGALINISEWALLAYAQDTQGNQLHIYWLRPKPNREAWQHGQYVIRSFARKYPQLFSLFIVRRKDGCWVACPHPNLHRRSWMNQPRAELTSDNPHLLNALEYNPGVSVEKHWQRVLRAVIGEEAMHPRIEQAFETFLAELNEILVEIQETIKRKVEEYRFDDVKTLSQQAQQVQQLIQDVERLREQQKFGRDGYAPASSASSRPSNSRQRASRGDITPQSAYTRPLLQALVDLGGQAQMEMVLNRVYELVKSHLKPKDLEKVSSGQDVRWRNAVMWMRYKLKQQGYISADSPKGIWEITDAGREYLKRLQADEAGDSGDES